MLTQPWTLGDDDDGDNDGDGRAFALWRCSSQVAWKVLEVYPVQMAIAREGAKLPPARITLGYAVRQREVQVSEKQKACCWRAPKQVIHR